MAEQTVGFTTTQPSTARIYDALLGGKDNFGADREAAARLIHIFPPAPLAARENRAFVLRAVRHLAEQGVRQFLDVGVGMPTWPTVREALSEALPDEGECGRVLYVDNDPLVLVHARALLTGGSRVEAAVLAADLCEPDGILSSQELAATIDLSRPVGLVLGAVLHSCEDESYPAVSRLVAALPSGSYVVLSHATLDFLSAAERDRFAALEPCCVTFRPRSRQEIAHYVAGLDLIEPGWVSTARWRPALQPHPLDPTTDHTSLSYAVVARIR
jgi:hypothetical protein